MVEPGGYRRPPTGAAAREQTMTFHEYLARARQHDAQQADEPDRPLRTARQARTVRRHRTGPAARTRRPARLMFRRATT
jgi:hypothetical protein